MAPPRKKAEPRKEESENESESASESGSASGQGSGDESASERSEGSDEGSDRDSDAEESGDEGSETEAEEEDGEKSDEVSERDARTESDVSDADGDEEENNRVSDKTGAKRAGGLRGKETDAGGEGVPASQPGSVQSGNATCPAPPLPPLATWHPAVAAAATLALQPWSPVAATLVVLGFALLLLRQVSAVIKTLVVLREKVNRLEADGASAGAGGDGGLGEGEESEGEEEEEEGSEDVPVPPRLESALFEFRPLVDEVLALTGGEACEKGVEIAALVMDSVPAAVVGDPLRLRQTGVCGEPEALTSACEKGVEIAVLVKRVEIAVLVKRVEIAVLVKRVEIAVLVKRVEIAVLVKRVEIAVLVKRVEIAVLVKRVEIAVLVKRVEIAVLVKRVDNVPAAVVILLNLFTVAVRLTDRGHIFLCVRVAFDAPHKPAAAAAAAAAPVAGSGAAGGGAAAGEGGDGGEEEKERAARGKTSLMKGEYLTLSGLPAVDGSNSWPAVCEMLKQQENRLKKSPSGGAAGGAAGTAAGTASAPAAVAASGSGSGGGGSAAAATAGGASGTGARAAADRRRRGIRLVFSLEDTGAGLPGEVLAARERPFEAVHMKLQQKYAGVPLLLCFAERLVNSMSGQMSLSTRVSTGTTVTFDVLLDQPPPGAPSPGTGGSSGGSAGGVGAVAGGGGGGGGAAAAAGGAVPRVFHIGYGAIGDDQHAECAGLRAKLRGMRCLVVDGRPVRQQVTATYLARMGLRVDLSDSVPAAALALRHSRHLPGG
ncbi:unnamed protein product [Closterium sp. NIES-65]|nr:unnamed protein product [Closterium sp. NIES-65]